MLRYFYEKLKDLFVIAAGSLFELMLEKSQISFPVGRVQFLYMYPLTFEEFLQAQGEERLLEAYRATPVKSFAVSKLFEWFHRYTMIGGMPEIVRHYSESKDVPSLKADYESLLTSYLDDADKYARNPSYAIPVKVKSGQTGALRSLHMFVNDSKHPYAVRLYEGGYAITDSRTPEGKPYKLINLPYFLSGRIRNYLDLLIT